MRISPIEFDAIHEMIKPSIVKQDSHLRLSISSEERLACTLGYLAVGGAMKAVAESFRIGVSTFTGIVYEVSQAIHTHLAPKHLVFPRTPEEWKEIAEEFWERWQFPNCVGAIDGKHITLEKPANSGSVYYNYKGYCSMVLLAVADARYRFRYVSVGSNGSESDGGIYRYSDINRVLPGVLPAKQALPLSQVELPFYLIGDEAFPLQEHLMRPFPARTLTDERRQFNYRLCRARRCVENAFGILAQVWRVLRAPMGCTPEHANLIVLAVTTLHNFRLDSAEAAATTSSMAATGIDTTDGALPSLRPTASGHSRAVSNGRDHLVSYICGEGSVSWQRSSARID